MTREDILKYLYKHPGKKAADIASKFPHNTRSDVNGILYGDLRSKGLVKSDIWFYWRLTPKGEAFVESLEKSWTPADEEKLRQLVADRVGIDEVCEALGRDTETVEEKMQELGVEYDVDSQDTSSPMDGENEDQGKQEPDDLYEDAFDDEEPEQQTVVEPALETQPELIVRQLTEDQLPIAEQLLSIIPEDKGISLNDLLFKHELDKEEIEPVLEMLKEQGAIRYDKYNRHWYLQDKKAIQEPKSEPSQPSLIFQQALPDEKTEEQLPEIVSDSVEKLNIFKKHNEQMHVAARYRITQNGRSGSYWLMTTPDIRNDEARRSIQMAGGFVAYKNSLMGICLQSTQEGADFTYTAPAGELKNHVHNAHVIHTHEIRIENDPKPYNYRQYVSLEAYMQLLRQTQSEYEQTVAEIEQKEKERENTDLTPIQKGQLTREINKMKEEKRQLAGQRDDLLLLSNYIREQGKLRYNPILDPKQTRIKTDHLYDGGTLVIDGGPGTGKTTTMIQRLKYLTDEMAIKEDSDEKQNRYHLSREQRDDLFERIRNGHDWIFFSPSQLLKSYLADAMNRDGLKDTNNKVWDWSEFRKTALREYRFIGYGKAFPFADCTETDKLIYPETAPRKQFIDFLKASICQEVAQLPTIEAGHIAGMSNNARRIVSELDGIERDTLQGIIRRLSRLQEIQLERTVDVETELEELTSLLKNEIAKDSDLLELLDDIKLPNDDIEFERPEDDSQSDLHFLVKNWLYAYCHDRFYPSEEHSAEYIEMLELLQDVVTKIDTPRLNRIGEGLIYERFHIFTKGVSKIILQRLPKYYKAFRKHIMEQNNTEDWNVELLKKIIKKDKRQLHFQEQALLLLITNDLIATINKTLPNNTLRHPYISAYNELVRPIIGIDEVTDFSEVEIQSIVSFALPAYHSITMAGDLMQRLTVSGIQSWEALDDAVQNKYVVELRTSYRQSKRMLEVAQQLYTDTIGESPNYKAHLQENKVPRPLIYTSPSEDKKIQWIDKRIEEVYKAYSNHLPATAIFLNSREEVTPFVEKMREMASIQSAGIEIVDGSAGNVLGSRQQIRVYPINVVKGLEFDVVFFHNIDSAGFDDETIKRYIYVGVSRAAFFLGATMSEEMPAISQYFSKQKNWKNFIDEETI